MLVVMRQHATAGGDRGGRARDRGPRLPAPTRSPGRSARPSASPATGARWTGPVFESLPGVLEVIPVTHAYKLVSREVKPEDTVVRVGDVAVGGKRARRRGRAVRGRVARADAHRGPRGEGGGRPAAARRRLQAPHEPVRVPGARGGGAADPRRAPARRPGCRWSPRPSTWRGSTSWSGGPTASRSAPATCRTSRCSGAAARRESPCC